MAGETATHTGEQNKRVRRATDEEPNKDKGEDRGLNTHEEQGRWRDTGVLRQR